MKKELSLIAKISQKKAHVGIIGLGYVGLPLVLEFCEAGFTVTGFDVDRDKIALLNQGKSYIKHIKTFRIKECSSHFTPTSDFSKLSDMDCVILCVPTPLNKNREPDMTYVFNTTKTVAEYLHRGQLIVLESTTYPGTTDIDMRKILEQTGLKAERISILPIPLKGKTRTTRSSQHLPFQKSSGVILKSVFPLLKPCMTQSLSEPCLFRPLRLRRQQSYSKIFTGP